MLRHITANDIKAMGRKSRFIMSVLRFINKCGSKVYLSITQNKGTLAKNHIGVFPLFNNYYGFSHK